MEDFERKERDEIYAKAVRAGKRTYFFDVKGMRSGEMYITVTESIKRFNQDNGRFFYEKHKLFLYKEDFDKFASGLEAAVHFIRTGEALPDDSQEDYADEHRFIEDISESQSEI